MQALIQYGEARSIEEKDLCRLWLSDLHPGKEFKAVEIEQFLAISHWVHMAVVAMTDLQGEPLTEERAIRILGKRSNPAEIGAAIDRLKNLGLLILREDGTLAASADSVSTPDDVANLGARNYHKNVMTLATDAIEHLPVENREFQACALAIPASRLALAKDMIRKFRAQFASAMSTEPGDEVYQFNIQFFQLTENCAAPKAVATKAIGTKSLKRRTAHVQTQI